MKRSARSSFLLIMAVVVAAVVMLPVSRAAAQGTSGALPGPINSQQLSHYGDRLRLSAAQRLAVDSAHDEYRREFRLLRDGEIAAFLREQQAVQGGIPERGVVEDLLEKVDRLNTKIAVLDNRLFDQMLPVLSDEQQSVVPRLRLERERRRYEPQVTAAAYGRRTMDLSALLLDRKLTSEQSAACDPIMVSYERRLTKTMRKQHKAITRMTLDMMDILAERGFSEISQDELLADPKLLEEVIGHIRGAYTDLRARVTELADDLRKLNDGTSRQILSVLPDDEALRFRNAYYRGAHPQLASVIALSETDWMTQALQLPDLSPDHQGVLEPLAGEYQRKLDGLLEKGIDILDTFWEAFSPFAVNQELGEQLRADLSALQKEAGEAKTLTQGQAEAQLGATVIEELTHAAVKLASAAASETEESTDEADDDPAADFAFSGDRFLPERISRRDIRRYSRQLQLERDMSEVLSALHLEYLERLSATGEFDQLREARNAADSDEDADSAQSPEQKIEHVYALRRKAIEAMVSADTAFFDDLGAIVGASKAPLLDLVRNSRHRQTYAGSASSRLSLGRDNSNEAGVDLVSIVLEEQPGDSELKSMRAVFTGYESEALLAFQARLDAQLDLQRLSDRWMKEIEAAGREDLATVIALQQRYREVMEEPTSRVGRTDSAIVELNRRTLDAIVAALPGDRGSVVRHEYQLAAFPSIYKDPASVEGHLAAALELDDLTAAQRLELADLGGAYLAEYAELTGEMIGHLGTSSVRVVGLDPDAFRAWQQQQQQLAKIRFDRNELNGRAISRLRASLTEEQLVRIGGLPEPLGEDDFYFYR